MSQEAGVKEMFLDAMVRNTAKAGYAMEDRKAAVRDFFETLWTVARTQGQMEAAGLPAPMLLSVGAQAMSAETVKELLKDWKKTPRVPVLDEALKDQVDELRASLREVLEVHGLLSIPVAAIDAMQGSASARAVERARKALGVAA